MKILHMIAFALLVIGGLNWLLFVFGLDIGKLFLGGSDSQLSMIVYVLVGLSAIFEVIGHKKNCKMCGTKPMQGM